MLRARNKLVAAVNLTLARLTVENEMATLYSRFAVCLSGDRLSNRHRRTEGSKRINRVFCDVFRHSGLPAVVKRRHFSIGGGVVLVALLGGCATGLGGGGLSADTAAEAKRDAVAARAKSRWDALIKLDVEGAYAFLSPASRETMPLDLYKAKHRVGMYRAVKVESVKCEADSCTVNLSLTYDHKRFKGITTPLVEKWIITQGQAWFVDKG